MLAFFVTLQSFVADRKNDDKGATAVEYGLMVALIAVAIIGAVSLLGDGLSDLFTGVDANVDKAGVEADPAAN